MLAVETRRIARRASCQSRNFKMTTASSRAAAFLRPKILLIAVAAIAILYAAHRIGAGPWLTNALDWIAGLGALAPVAFIAIYIAACVAFLPGSILTIGAGVIFGVVRGSIYVSIAATLGATAAFLVGRYLARDWVSERLEGNAKSRRGAERRGDRNVDRSAHHAENHAGADREDRPRKKRDAGRDVDSDERDWRQGTQPANPVKLVGQPRSGADAMRSVEDRDCGHGDQ